MKILVLIKKVPDTTTKITIKEQQVNEEGIQWIMNPYDEWYALVKAIELKEADATTQVDVLSVGDATVEPILRKALSYGADAAYRINTTTFVDAYAVALEIADFVAKNPYDLILLGKESIDQADSAVGAMLAAALDYPFVGYAHSLEMRNEKAEVQTFTEEGEATLAISLPVVISCTKGMATQRMPNMRGIMAARTKPLQVVESSNVQPLTRVKSVALSPAKPPVQLFDIHTIDNLISILKDKKIL